MVCDVFLNGGRHPTSYTRLDLSCDDDENSGVVHVLLLSHGKSPAVRFRAPPPPSSPAAASLRPSIFRLSNRRDTDESQEPI